MQYFIKRGEKIKGPFAAAKIVEFVRANMISGADLIANDELGPFQSLSGVWPAIQRTAESEAPRVTDESNTTTATCGNCNSPVFKNAMSCPKCGNPLQAAPPPIGFEKSQTVDGSEPGQVVSPQTIPVNPVQPTPIPKQPASQPSMPVQYPQPQPGQYTQTQPGQFPQPQPVQQQYVQPMPVQGYVQGVAQSGAANSPVPKPAKNKRKAKKGRGSLKSTIDSLALFVAELA